MDWAIHDLIGISLWIPLSIAILVLVFKYITRKWWKEQSQRGSNMSPGAIAIVATLILFVCIPGRLAFTPAMVLGISAAILGLFWIRLSGDDDPSAPT